MRVMFKATLDTEKANEVVREDQMAELMKEIVDRIKPEAAYFGPLGGRRTVLMVVEMRDSSELPPLVEPFFTQLNAEIEVVPVMNADDLQKGLSRISRLP
ncbi:DUF3303 family protein [Streptomyces sp. V3I7]|uniref:DUF3303 family protein n=1 Tax=Streptomyces sp. V3I7 TaxID=3042278 RepID=UPI002784BDC7|nr:DUF3303 family protein [Streptomyces sp. V3I7]MDQ0992073.1 hypothetical protein [Streptomyces sp. V3I7]